MKLKYLSIIILAVMPVFVFPASAAIATSSDAYYDPDTDYDEDELADMVDMELIYDLEVDDDSQTSSSVLAGISDTVDSINDLLLSVYAATASDASLAAVDADSSDDDDEDLTSSYVGVRAVSGEEDLEDTFINMLRYDVTISGNDYILLMPVSYIDSLYVDADGKLYNVSGSTISGRLIADESSFDPYASEGDMLYLTSVLGNNFSTIYSYGAPNYLRSYYISSGRVTYSDSYVDVYVTSYHQPFLLSDMTGYLLLFLIGGGVLILWLQTYRKY